MKHNPKLNIAFNHVFGKTPNKAALKRFNQFYKNINVPLMCSDLGLDIGRIRQSVLYPKNTPEIQRLWQEQRPLSERCIVITDAIFPIHTEHLTNAQLAGISILAKALYVSAEVIEAMATRKKDPGYLRNFLGLDHTSDSNFKYLLTQEREKFRALLLQKRLAS